MRNKIITVLLTLCGLTLASWPHALARISSPAVGFSPAASVTMTVTPAAHCIMAGQSATYTIDLERVNYDGPVTFSASGLPPGATGLFEPSTSYGNRVLFSLRTPLNLGNSETKITITGTANGIGSVLPRSVMAFTNCGIQWVRQLGSSAKDNHVTPSNETQTKVTTDGAGNVYLVGNTLGVIDPDGYNGTETTDVWLAKYDPYGNQKWIRQFGSPAEDRATEVTTDSAGNVYAAGYTFGALGGASNGGADVWLAKYDETGRRLWVAQEGNQFEDGPYGLELTLDEAAGHITLTAVTGNRTHLSRFSFDQRNGQTLALDFFPLQLGSGASVNEMAVARDGSIFIAGDARLRGRIDAFLVKYDAAGARQWQAQIDNIDGFYSKAVRVSLDSAGNAYVAGYTTADPSGARGATEDGWVAKYEGKGDGNGNDQQLWLHTIATSAQDEISGLAIDATSNLYVTGLTRGSLAFTNAGGADAWLLRLDADGAQMWVRQLGTATNDNGLAVTVDDAGGFALVTGITDGSLDLSRCGDRNDAPNCGNDDVWVMKYAVPAGGPSITDFSPASGRVGTRVAINGANLNQVSIFDGVRFNGIGAHVVSITSAQIVAEVPARATRGRITVTDQGGCATALSATDFVVLP